MRATLRELLPAVAESLTPPDREGTDWDALGASAEEIRDFAIGGLARRLNVIGVPLSTLFEWIKWETRSSSACNARRPGALELGSRPFSPSSTAA